MDRKIKMIFANDEREEENNCVAVLSIKFNNFNQSHVCIKL